MARDYIIVRPKLAENDIGLDGESYLARTVFETVELIDIGILDVAGNKLMARKRMDPIGFLRHQPS